MLRGIALGVLVASGCGTPSIALGDADDDALQATCKRLARCGVYADEMSCETATRQFDDPSLTAAIDAGKVRYDGVQAKQCFDALSAITCDGTTREARTPPAACAKIYTGSVADGDDCAFDRECASGVCVPITTCAVGACCPGTCESPALAVIGDACQLTRDCVADTYCGLDHVCHALGGDGDSCFTDAQCDFTFGCIAATLPGTCRELPALGAPCPDRRCADIGAACDASGTCVAAGLPGAPCASGTDCSSAARCDPGSHLCADQPGLGMPCDLLCAGEAWCDLTHTPGTCVAPETTTTPCNSNDECQTNYCAEGPVFDACTDPLICT